MELKRLDLTKQSFEANGETYYIESSLSIGRFCEFQILEKEIGFSMSFKSIFAEILSIMELMDETKFVQCSVKLDNLVRGVAKLEEKEPVAIKLCTLFINTKDEDRSIWNNDIMTKKIEDWKKEGIDVKDFFRLALNSVDGFADIYGKMSERISGKMSGEEMNQD